MASFECGKCTKLVAGMPLEMAGGNCCQECSSFLGALQNAGGDGCLKGEVWVPNANDDSEESLLDSVLHGVFDVRKLGKLALKSAAH